MAKREFPWPGADAVTAPLWRGRHQRMGDTIPPTRTPGPPSATTSCPFSESRPSGLPSGVYDDYARALGYHEPPTVERMNRPVYDLSCDTDRLMQKDDAVLRSWLSPALGLGVVTDVDLMAVAWDTQEPAIYTGPASTLPYTTAFEFNRCSNYVALRDSYSLPITDPATSGIVHVSDIKSDPAGPSLYGPAIRPAWDEVYPFGTVGIIDSITVPGVAAPSDITFSGAGAGTPPSGTPAAGPVSAVCFFNYTLYERLLSTDASVEYTSMQKPYAISMVRTAGPPDVYSMNRDVTAAGWAEGDVVYTTFVAYRPTLVLETAVSLAGKFTLLAGSPCAAGFGDAYRFMTGARMFMDPWTTLPVPLEIEEPPSATLKSFDYANALIRSNDGLLKGTVMFDARGGGYTSPASTLDPFASFLNRKALSFDAASPTQIPFDAPVTLGAGTLTLTNPGDQFTDGGGATHIIPGIDLVEVTNAGGVVVGLYVIRVITGQTTAAVSELNGVTTVDVVNPGTVRVYRSFFLSAGDGDWSAVAADDHWRAAGVFVGEALSANDNEQAIPLVMHAAGTNYLARGFNGPWDDRLAGAGTTDPSAEIFRIVSALTSGRSAVGDIGFGQFDATPTQGEFIGPRYATYKGPGGGTDIRVFEARIRSDFDWPAGAVPYAGGEPVFRFMNYSYPNVAPGVDDYLIASFLHIEPTIDGGIPLGAAPNSQLCGLVFGGASDQLFQDPTSCPDFGIFIAGPSDADTDYAMVKWGLHRDGASGIGSDMFCRMSDRDPNDPPLPPTIDPAGLRMEVSWNGNNPVGKLDPKINYAWEAARTFAHHCPLSSAISLSTLQDFDVSGGGSTYALEVPHWHYVKTAQGNPEYWEATSDTGSPPPVGGGFATLVVPVNLPDGVTVTGVEIIYQFTDEVLSAPMHGYFVRQQNDWQPLGGAPPPWFVASAGVLATQEIFHGEIPIATNPGTYDVHVEDLTGVAGSDVIDNGTYTYCVYIQAGTTVDPSSHYIWGVRLLYAMRDFLPA